MTREDFKLVCTCGACPEQYDMYLGKKQVAYFRLRHGWFYVSVPGVGGLRVYETGTIGDGVFDCEERELHLNAGMDAVIAHLQAQ